MVHEAPTVVPGHDRKAVMSSRRANLCSDICALCCLELQQSSRNWHLIRNLILNRLAESHISSGRVEAGLDTGGHG